jgi:hypothetical protein
MPLDHLLNLPEAKVVQKLLVNIKLTTIKSTWLSGTLGHHDATGATKSKKQISSTSSSPIVDIK